MEAFMKNFIRMCALLSVVTTFAAVSVLAAPTTVYKVEIPFSFNIGQKTYPAGKYVIKLTHVSSSASQLTLENAGGESLEHVFVAHSGEVRQGHPILVFNRYDSQTFLAKIVSSDNGMNVPLSKLEKQIVKKQGKRGADVARIVSE